MRDPSACGIRDRELLVYERPSSEYWLLSAGASFFFLVAASFRGYFYFVVAGSRTTKSRAISRGGQFQLETNVFFPW